MTAVIYDFAAERAKRRPPPTPKGITWKRSAQGNFWAIVECAEGGPDFHVVVFASPHKPGYWAIKMQRGEELPTFTKPYWATAEAAIAKLESKLVVIGGDVMVETAPPEPKGEVEGDAPGRNQR